MLARRADDDDDDDDNDSCCYGIPCHRNEGHVRSSVEKHRFVLLTSSGS